MKTFSLHKIDDKDNIPFSEANYSKFKFGCKTVAKYYGYGLAEGFIEELDKAPITNQIVVVSSPYCFIPTATFAMKDYFIKKLNTYLIDKGLLPVQETKIHRTVTYKEDYGELSAEDRMNLIGADGFHIDKEFVDGKTCLFLDDIKITGSHEKVIQKMIVDNGLNITPLFLYYAELENKHIHPKIENYLNYYTVKSLVDLNKIIKNDNFLLNTRTVKYILNSNFSNFKEFIHYQSDVFIDSIYHSAIGNSYHLIDDYKQNLTYIKQLLK